MTYNWPRTRKMWTPTDSRKFKDMYGNYPWQEICKTFGITFQQFHNKVKIENLGLQRDRGCEITCSEAARLIGVSYGKILRFILNHGLTSRKVFYGQGTERYCNMIDFDTFVKWLEQNQDRYDSRTIEYLALGFEFDWLREKRRRDLGV